MSNKNNYYVTTETVILIFAITYSIKSSLQFAFDTDVFMMIKSGESIWQLKGMPVFDRFSFVPQNCKVPWINYEWLAHLIAYKIFSNFNMAGIIIYKTAFYCLSYFILFWYSKDKYGRLPAVISLVIAVYLGRWFMSPRPMLYTAVMFPLLTFILFKLEKEKLAIKHFILIPLMFILWSNLHGGFFVGLVYFALGLGILSILRLRNESEKKSKIGEIKGFVLLWLLCFAMTLVVTPYGFKNFKYVLDFLFFRPVFMRSASDMQSPFLRMEFNVHYFIITITTFLALILYTVRFKKKISPLEAFAYLFWLFCSLRAARNMQLYSTACIPVFSFILYNLLTDIRKSRIYNAFSPFMIKNIRYLNFVNIFIIFTIVLLFSLFAMNYDFSGISFEKNIVPVHLKDFLSKNSLPEKLFNHDILGNYLLFHLYPDYRVAYDSRWNNVYTDKYFLEVNGAFFYDYLFFKFIDKYDIDTVIAQYKYYPCFIEKDPKWILIYEGEGCRIFLRNEKRNEELIQKFKDDLLEYPDIYEINAFLYRVNLNWGNLKTAKKYLIRLIIENPEEKILRNDLKILNNQIKTGV